MRPYSLTHAALDDLGLLIDYIAARNPPAARRVRDEIFEAFDLLADHPLMGHRRSDLTALPVRFWTVRSFLIVYGESKPIEIVRILHGRRDVASELAQKDRSPEAEGG